MAKYLIVKAGPIKAVLTEGKNLKAAVAAYGAQPGDELVAWRVAAGPITVKVRSKETTVIDIQEATGGSWETGEEE